MRRHAIEVDRQIGVHRRQHGGIDAAEQRILHHDDGLLCRSPGPRRAARPIDDVVFERAGAALADRAAAHRNAGLMDRIRVAGHQRMPPGEVLALGDPAIGAGGRQPVDLPHFRRRQADAVGHAAAAVGVVAAPAGVQVEQAAGDVGEGQRAGVVVPQLVQAAAAAAVAEGFPLGARHLLEPLGLPERGGGGHLCRLPRVAFR